jgi:hypothetical protein
MKLRLLPAPIALALLTTLGRVESAAAAERHFGFSYESAVLAPGLAELEPWSTVRSGRDDYYSRIDARLGFQFGLVKGLQGAVFWNVTSTNEDRRLPGAALKSRLSSTEFQSLTAQLKYRFSDAVTDAVGSALLVDGTFGPLAAGVEGRLIVDDQLGSLLLVLNLLGGRTQELELISRSLTSFGASAAAGYFLTPKLLLGLELRNENSGYGQVDRSVLYLGPTLSFSSARYYLTLAVQPQITAFKGATAGHDLDLNQNEYLQTRFLFGFPL